MKGFILCYSIIIGMMSSSIFNEKTKEDSIEAGKEIYNDFCIQCHLTTGEGVSGVFPPL